LNTVLKTRYTIEIEVLAPEIKSD